jgi:N-acyl-D-aspartate/D-glutamate deacylase
MDVLLRDGQVAEIAPPGKTRATAHEKFDARGLIVAPGFIDLHVHLREPGRATRKPSPPARPRQPRRIHFRLLHAQHAARG